MSRIQLAASPLGGIPGVMAYHTSVLVDGQEYSFSNAGVCKGWSDASHRAMGKQPMLLDIGTSGCSAAQLLSFLGNYFRRGTYNLLKKNCNSWTDAAIYFLLRQRLPLEYRMVEQLGVGLVPLWQAASCKHPPRQEEFDIELLIKAMESNGIGRTAFGPDEDESVYDAEVLLVKDERLAHRLQAEEEADLAAETAFGAAVRQLFGHTSPGPRHIHSDEEFAHALQAELNLGLERPSKFGGGSGSRQPDSSGDHGQGVQEVMAMMSGVVSCLANDSALRDSGMTILSAGPGRCTL